MVAPARSVTRGTGAGLDLTLAGAVGVAVGIAGLAAKLVGLIPRVRIATLSWGAVVLVIGWALASRGSLNPKVLRPLLNEPLGRLPLLLVSGVAWSVAFIVEVRTDWWWKDGVAVAVAIISLAVAARSFRGIDARTVVSALLAALAVTYFMSALFKREQYPFAPFQMYSVSQLDPREVVRYKLFATTADGEELDISSIMGTATIAELVSNPDDGAVAEAVRLAAGVHEERRGSDLVSVRVVTETWQVVPYPGEAAVETVDSVERMQVDV